MVTKVGMQEKFVDAAKDLLELESDVIEAYEVAINRIEHNGYKEKLIAFARDHHKHIEELSKVLENNGIKFEVKPDISQWMAKGRVILGNLMGDESILKAILSSENDANTAYERISRRDDVWADARDVINSGLNDQRNHKAWFEQVAA